MTPAYTEAQVRSRLTEWIATHGYVKAVQHFEVTESYLRKCCLSAENPDSRPPGPAILKGLGLIRAYVPAPTLTNKARVSIEAAAVPLPPHGGTP